MKKSKPLRNCAFCGSNMVRFVQEGYWESEHFVQCTNCGARSGLYKNMETAQKYWDRRAWDVEASDEEE